nr:hypothetical protein [Enterobacter chuandaensis]
MLTGPVTILCWSLPCVKT